MAKIRLGEIAHARSGDKGADANVGVIAFTASGFEVLRESLTCQVVASHFEHLRLRDVERFELPKLGALNFLLRGALGEGGSRSLRIDAQGKAFGAAILELRLAVDENRLRVCRRPADG
jgi:hypothetical protein